MKFWTYISTLLVGIIAGLLIFLKLKDPETTINENTQIGKMKQRGQGNDASITIKPETIALDTQTRKEKREARRSARLERRRERREKRQSESP